MQRRKNRRRVDGVLLLDKPSGMTSNAALQSARRLFEAAKAGHTGTLDPMATGLLPLAFGEATKFSQMLLEADKAYTATIRFGVETDTGDAEGVVTATHPVEVTAERVEAVLQTFTGKIEQVPPMFSALKRDGKPLYEYARAGIELEREARQVTIFSLKATAFDADRLSIEVDCSKGTYIRSLAMDIGAALGCGAHLEALCRTRIGPFRVADAITLTALETMESLERDSTLRPVDALTMHFPRFDLNVDETAAMLHGQPLNVVAEGRSCVRLYAADGFVGLGEWRADGRLWPRRLVAMPPGA